jgi:hypothetical protein
MRAVQPCSCRFSPGATSGPGGKRIRATAVCSILRHGLRRDQRGRRGHLRDGSGTWPRPLADEVAKQGLSGDCGSSPRSSQSAQAASHCCNSTVRYVTALHERRRSRWQWRRTARCRRPAGTRLGLRQPQGRTPHVVLSALASELKLVYPQRAAGPDRGRDVEELSFRFFLAAHGRPGPRRRTLNSAAVDYCLDHPQLAISACRRTRCLRHSLKRN